MKWHRAVPHQEYALTYNESGSLVSDAGRNIANIEYDNMNNPVRIQFTDGNVTKYVYSAAGEKLRVIYQTAVPNITVAIGSTRELSIYETLHTETIDYLLGGALTLKNGRIDKYQFEEGYCQATESSDTSDGFYFCYYEKDHLGNIRQVRKVNRTQNGEVIQTNNYYPFGAEFCDGSANYSVQSHKYNGKEFDRMHGLNTYDYGARQYNPITARWDRIDPLAHEYHAISPYVYCVNNPMRFIDPDGRQIKITGDIQLGLEYLQYTLPKDLRQYVTINNGYVDVNVMRKGLSTESAQNSVNFQSLYELVSDNKVVEYSIDENKEANDINGNPISNIPLPFNDPVCDEYSNYEPEIIGSVGWSLAPTSHHWTKNDAEQRGATPNPTYSTTENYHVQINKRILKYDNLKSYLVISTAHELYGHILFMFRNKDSLHYTDRTEAGRNVELEEWIKHRSNEAKINYIN